MSRGMLDLPTEFSQQLPQIASLKIQFWLGFNHKTATKWIIFTYIFGNVTYASVIDAKQTHMIIVYAKLKSKRMSDKIEQTNFVRTYSINLVLT